MSVLKYNNNGTWEGLNIDHASTADSALYDADGNVISSTYAKTTDLGLYLPLTAGSSKPLTGNLYFDSAGTQDIYFYQSGTKKAKLEMQTSDGAFILAKCATNGNSLAGIDVSESKDTIVFSDGTATGVFLRANGITANATQAYLDTTGYFHFGYEGSESKSKAISGTVDGTVKVWRRGNVVYGEASAGNGTTLSSFTSSGVSIGPISSAYRPPRILYFVGTARTGGAWATATYYPITLSIGADGYCTFIGNQTNIRSCQYIELTFCYPVA